MRIQDGLQRIRIPWLQQVAGQMARGTEVRESFTEQLDRFYDLLIQAVETGDPAWLDPILDEWASARTQSELKQELPSLSPLLDQMVLATHSLARQILPAEEALVLIGAVLPGYIHAYAYTNHQETRLNFENYSRELQAAKLSLERLDKSKSDFISIAAHELKTPLTLIEGYGSMLQENLSSSEQDARMAILLRGIGNGTRRLREIIDDMIDVSMIDNNILALNFQPAWMNRIIDLIVREFAATIADRHLKLVVHPFAGMSSMIYADSERLYQAFRNLISNAIKYTPDNGEIHVDGRSLPGFLEITIQDTGIGIALEDQPRIFEKFGIVRDASLHSSGKTKFKGGGPGLGLAIAKGIVDAHGGTIWVESEGYDEETCPGTTFHVLIPSRSNPPDDRIAQIFEGMSDMLASVLEAETATHPPPESGNTPE